MKVFGELARGCGSGAWVTMIFSQGAFTASLFDEQARQDIWGQTPHATVCGQFAPTGSGRRTDGGLVVSGRWQPLSGIHEAEWAMLGTSVEGGAPVVVLMPLAEGSVEETWQMAGMQGTGSNTFIAENVFIPGHRILPYSEILSGRPRRHPEEPLYSATYTAYPGIALLGPVLGMARGILDETLAVLDKGKPIAGSKYRNITESPSTQIRVADAVSSIDTAHLHAFRAVENIEHGITSGSQLDLPTRARIRMDVGVSVTQARSAARSLLGIGASSRFSLAHPAQRLWRDLETATSHVYFNPDLSREIYGRAVLGIAEQVAPVI
jgi:3-hydroxy-9,10-secoandrosta-1,3,5(10)-triene-9,17-dione monooxygenase